MMYLHSLATASPDVSYTQKEVWEIFSGSPAPQRLRPGSVELVRKVLRGENGISRRHFALPDFDYLLGADGEALNHAFEREAPVLGAKALSASLAEGGWKPAELDALIVCTCTGYLCPGLSSFIAEREGLSPDCFLLDLVGQGCGAAVPAMRTASGILAANPEAKVAVVAVEVCTAAFYLDDEAGVLVSFCLFGDGAAATLWTGQGRSGDWYADGFDTLHLPADRQLLRFENSRGMLRNRLHSSIPEASSRAVGTLYERRLARDENPPGAIVSHGGGIKVVEAVEERLARSLAPATREILNEHGNMSSPSVLFALQRHLGMNRHDAGDSIWLTSFGAGFTVYGMDLRKDPR